MKCVEWMVVGMMLVAPIASACQICVEMPEKSAADWVAASDLVVLATEDPEKAFDLVITETLKGELDDEIDVDYYLDSTTRKRLASNAERRLVLVRVQDGEDVSWRSLGMTSDGRLLGVVRDLVDRSGAWNADPATRYAYFAKLLASDHELLRKLAHIELTRAPYQTVKKLGKDGVISRQDLHAFLNEVSQTEWHHLYILLLAQSDHPDDQQRVINTMNSIRDHSVTVNLEAWATAYVEVTGAEGVGQLKESYIDNKHRSEAEKAAVTNALKLHGKS